MRFKGLGLRALGGLSVIGSANPIRLCKPHLYEMPPESQEPCLLSLWFLQKQLIQSPFWGFGGVVFVFRVQGSVVPCLWKDCHCRVLCYFPPSSAVTAMRGDS